MERKLDVILDFCAWCGTLLPEGLGQEDRPCCPNCGESIKTERIQGWFETAEADALKELHFGAQRTERQS